MHKMNKYYYLILISIFISCMEVDEKEDSNTNNPHSAIQNMDIRSPTKGVALTDYLQVETVVELETSEEAILKNIDKIYIQNDTLFLVHLESMVVKAFDKSGVYLFDIGKLGKGPGEYFSLFDVCLSKNDQSIWFNEASRKKLINYTTSGAFIGEVDRPAYPRYFAPINDNQWIFYMDFDAHEFSENHNLIVTNTKFTITDQYLPYPDYNIPSFKTIGYLSKSHSGGILVNEAFSDTIHEWNNGELYPKYRIEFVDKRKSVRMDALEELWPTRMKEGNIRRPIFENKDILSFRYLYKEKLRAAFWHRKRKELLTNESFDNGDLLLHLFPPKGMTEDGLLIGAIVPGWFYKGYTKNQPGFLPFLKENYPQLYEATMRMEDVDNPYLVYYRIK